MRTHTQRAHWHAQDTVAKTLLAAAHAKRRAAQGRLILCGGPHGATGRHGELGCGTVGAVGRVSRSRPG